MSAGEADTGGAAALARAGAGLGPPCRALGEDQHGDDEHDGDRQLRRAAEVRAVDPGRVDDRRQAVDAEILHGAQIVDHFHHGERGAHHERRPADGKGDREEGAPAAGTQRARRGVRRSRLHQEEGAAGGIGIGVEHEAEHEHRTGEAADLREPVVLRGGSTGDGAQQRLGGAGEIEQFGEAVGGEVGRNGERQHQQPLEPGAAGEIVMGHEPCGHEADDAGEEADTGHQRAGVAQRDGQHAGGEAATRPGGERRRRQPEDRQAHDQHQRKCRNRRSEGSTGSMICVVRDQGDADSPSSELRR